MEVKKKIRPQTPHVEIGNFSRKDDTKDNLFKNFNNFMKQIVDNQNEKFLNGTMNIVDYILAKYLNIDITEVCKIEKMSIKINGDYGLLNQFGDRLPQLLSLKLNNSFIQSITDIGSTFKSLKVLQLNNCMLNDISGLICFENLEILEAKNNKLEDLFEIEMCTNITKLNLENNLIEKDENLDFLSSLDKLTWLNLSKNPIKNYEEKLKNLIPSLKTIDSPDEIVSNEKETNDLIVNQSTSTNESSPQNAKKTNIDFYKSKIKVEDVLSIASELQQNKTISNFNVSKGALKPVIMKKEEDRSIKSLRQSLIPNNEEKSFLTSFTHKKQLDKLVPKKDPYKISSLK